MDEQRNDGLGFEPLERLPWLEPVDEAPQDSGTTAKLIGLVVAGLVGIGAIVGGLWYWQNAGANGSGELIAAPDEPYKVAPKAEPGRFDGDGNVAVAAAEGVQPVGTVDPGRLPEQPVPPPVAGGAPKARPAAAPSATPVKAVAPTVAARTTASAPAPAAATGATGGGGTVQLGAFASEATAVRAWDGLKARFEWLQPVNRSVVAAEVNGRTVYRLRAAAGTNSAARTLCNRLRVAGENCIVLP